MHRDPEGGGFHETRIRAGGFPEVCMMRVCALLVEKSPLGPHSGATQNL